MVVAEGDKTGKNVFELADYVEKNLPEYEVRVSVLGHMQRGGSPSCYDRVLASRLGIGAVDALLEGKSDMMVGIKDKKLTYVPFDLAISGENEIDIDLRRVADITSI